jgi:tetrahydromethanopterin S-methyltransferase subunit B
MNLNKIVNGIAQSGDPGAYLRQEIEEGISPITERIDRLEKKVDMLILTLKSVEGSLKKLQPLYDFVVKLPFFKK